MYSGRSLWLSCRAVSQLLAIPMLASGLSVPAAAATTGGHGALALAAIIGQYDPALTSGVRAGLLRLLADEAFGGIHKGNLIVKADVVTCRAGDVDLKAFGCTLTFGTHTVTLKGRQAAELYATLIEAGVPSDGAAGTLYESAKALSCALTSRSLAALVWAMVAERVATTHPVHERLWLACRDDDRKCHCHPSRRNA